MQVTDELRQVFNVLRVICTKGILPGYRQPSVINRCSVDVLTANTDTKHYTWEPREERISKPKWESGMSSPRKPPHRPSYDKISMLGYTEEERLGSVMSLKDSHVEGLVTSAAVIGTDISH